jgi:hypothetical protein
MIFLKKFRFDAILILAGITVISAELNTAI